MKAGNPEYRLINHQATRPAASEINAVQGKWNVLSRITLRPVCGSMSFNSFFMVHPVGPVKTSAPHNDPAGRRNMADLETWMPVRHPDSQLVNHNLLSSGL
jgi:hypothetical protein